MLDEIIAQRREDVEKLEIPSLDSLTPCSKNTLDTFKSMAKTGEPIFITEFKRRSPSLGEIAYHPLVERVKDYASKGASAISVLTEPKHFDGSLDDLKTASEALADLPILMKDFLIHPDQINLARKYGASMVLMIVRILDQNQIQEFFERAELLNMTILVEIHDENDLEKIRGFKPELMGINARNLDDLSLRLMRIPLLAKKIDWPCLKIAESGITGAVEGRICRDFVDGYLIGSALMHEDRVPDLKKWLALERKYFFKACGLKANEIQGPDLLGYNISPLSKRRFDDFGEIRFRGKEVLVVKGNPLKEVKTALKKHPFQWVQVYVDEFETYASALKNQKILLAFKDAEELKGVDLGRVDGLIMDGAHPGKGKEIDLKEVMKMELPFFLAGGMHSGNLERLRENRWCMGVDMASGIEEEGKISQEKILEVVKKLKNKKEEDYVGSNG